MRQINEIYDIAFHRSNVSKEKKTNDKLVIMLHLVISTLGSREKNVFDFFTFI